MAAQSTLKSRLPEIERELAARMAEAVQMVAEQAVRDMEAQVPVESGALKESIKAELAGPMAYRVSAGSDEVDYAPFVEWGVPSRNMAAHPFFVPAVMKARRALPIVSVGAIKKL